MTEIKYDVDMEINPDELDMEWLKQPALAVRYAKHAAQMRKLATISEEKVKVTRSELISEANEDSEGLLGKAKPNAADIEAYYRNHKDHKQAKQEWVEAEHEASLADMAYREVSWTRRAALENLVRLHAAQYFAGPSVPRDLSKEWESNKRQSSSDSKVASAMRRRERK